MNKQSSGVVKYFNPKSNHGKILSPDTEEEVYIHISDIIGEAVILLAGERVEFVLEKGPQSYVAKSLHRVQPRLNGEVIEFEKGKGIVECQQDGKHYPIYYRDFVGTDGIPLYRKEIRVKCESGDELEFYTTFDDRYGEKAVQIIMVDSRKPLEKFAYLPNLEQQLERLSNLTMENWDYLSNRSAEKYPVLKNYLLYTFSRLKREEKLFNTDRIFYSKAQTSWNGTEREIECACFNTGLADRFQQEIFAFFEENLNKKYSKDPKWVLKGFFTSNKGPMVNFRQKPEGPNYFRELDSMADLLFNPDIYLEMSYEHILEERDTRFPEMFRNRSISDASLRSSIETAKNKAIKRVRRNYKTAIPQYFNHKIQLLLPLCLQHEDKVDVALVVEKKGDIYYASTVLDLEKAYSNARLIAKPDREWLDPTLELKPVPLGKNEPQPVNIPAPLQSPLPVLDEGKEGWQEVQF